MESILSTRAIDLFTFPVLFHIGNGGGGNQKINGPALQIRLWRNDQDPMGDALGVGFADDVIRVSVEDFFAEMGRPYSSTSPLMWTILIRSRAPHCRTQAKQHRRLLPMLGTVKLLFQPAEEGGAGAYHMIKDGALTGVEAIFGMHVDYQLLTGTIASLPGPTQAAVCFFEVKVEGRSGNAPTPHFESGSSHSCIICNFGNATAHFSRR